jgi:U6 snRNA-associated Sm-like protein LSm7
VRDNFFLLKTNEDPDDPEQVTSQTRRLGLVVIRGTQVSLVSPEDGTEEIANPFLAGPDEEEEAEE